MHPAGRLSESGETLIAPRGDPYFRGFAFGNGDNAQGLAYVQQAVDEYGGNLHGDLAGAFLTSYQADNDLSVACAAVGAFIADNLNLLTAF